MSKQVSGVRPYSIIYVLNTTPRTECCVRAQDVEVLWRSAVLHSEDVQSAIRPHLPALRDLHNPPKTSVIKKGAPAWRYLDMVMLLQRAHLLRTTRVPFRSSVVDDPRCREANTLSLQPQAG